MLLRLTFQYNDGNRVAVTTDRFASIEELKASMQNDPAPNYAVPSMSGATLIRRKDVDGDILIEEISTGGITVTEETINTEEPVQEAQTPEVMPKEEPDTKVYNMAKPKEDDFNLPATSGNLAFEFTSFREKFLGEVSKQNSFMSQIVDKMASRTEKLRRARDLLNDQNESLQNFSDETLKL